MQFSSYHTLIQPIQERAGQDPERLAMVFQQDDGSEEKISAAEFFARALDYASALRAVGVGEQDLVILVLQHSKQLLFAFWGAMVLGAIGSIFPFLTEKLDPVIYRERVKELVTHSRAKAVITFPEFKQDLSLLLAEAGCVVLSSSEILLNPGGDTLSASAGRDSHLYSSDKIAFLQHSSGTTGLQKGVALSHRAVLNQIEAYSQAIGLEPDDMVVSWLPLYHDMGLIAGFIMPLVTGIPLVLLSPFKWVRDPKVLLQAIHRHHATLCWMPNFAYSHSARVIRPGDLDGLDLSHMRAFINCSEPVYLQSHQAFLARFAVCGVREKMLSTCYAMAENTFAVTQNPSGKAARVDWVNTRQLQEERRALPEAANIPGATALVSCGLPIAGTEVCIVDEQGRRFVEERRVGEIALRADCMLSGYYRRPDLTAGSIRALADRPEDGGWYFTGDMGYLAEGELFITGRKKDLIIVGGKNIYPQDLEAIANEIPGLVPGRNVAFGLLDRAIGSESIVMVCELDGNRYSDAERKALEMELRRRVVQRSEVALADVRLVQKRWLIKTSSGKISRSANRDKYLREFVETMNE